MRSSRSSCYLEVTSSQEWSPNTQNVSTLYVPCFVSVSHLLSCFTVLLNSLLSLLNARERMRNQMVSDGLVSIPLTRVTQERGTASVATSGDRSITSRYMRLDFDIFDSRKVAEKQICHLEQKSSPMS